MQSVTRTVQRQSICRRNQILYATKITFNAAHLMDRPAVEVYCIFLMLAESLMSTAVHGRTDAASERMTFAMPLATYMQRISNEGLSGVQPSKQRRKLGHSIVGN